MKGTLAVIPEKKFLRAKELGALEIKDLPVWLRCRVLRPSQTKTIGYVVGTFFFFHLSDRKTGNRVYYRSYLLSTGEIQIPSRVRAKLSLTWDKIAMELEGDPGLLSYRETKEYKEKYHMAHSH